MSKAPLLPLLALMLPAGTAGRPASTPPMPLSPPPAESLIACAPLPRMFATAGEAVAWVSNVTALYVDCDARRRVAVEAWPR
mgnify:FL=1